MTSSGVHGALVRGGGLESEAHRADANGPVYLERMEMVNVIAAIEMLTMLFHRKKLCELEDGCVSILGRVTHASSHTFPIDNLQYSEQQGIRNS